MHYWGASGGLWERRVSSRGISGSSYNWILAEFLSPAPSTRHRLQEYSPLHDTLTLYSTVVTICATPLFGHTVYVLSSVALRTGFICLWNITGCSLVAECVDCFVDVMGGAQSGTVTGVYPSTSVFPCQYHSTNAVYTFIHLPPTLYNVSLPALQFSSVSIIPPMLNTHSFTYHPLYNVYLPVLQFSPVSTIPPMLHTHSFTYHPRYIMFLSQYFSFPLSVSFHHCSILLLIL